MVQEGLLLVCLIKSDRNCLFSALAHQIWRSPPNLSLNNLHARTSRATVVSFYRDRYDFWKDRLLPQAAVIFPELANVIASSQLII